MKFLPRRSDKKQQPVGRQPLRQPLGSERSKQAFSYYTNRSQNEINVGRTMPTTQRQSLARTRFKTALQHLPILIAAVVIFVCVIDELSLNSNAKIVPLSTTSSKVFLRSTNEYTQAAQKLLNASVANHNKLTIDASGISKAIEQKFPELSDVSMTLPLLGHRPIVYIEPSDPALILQTNHGSFVVDKTGKALIEVTGTVDVSQLHLPTVVDKSGLNVHTGQDVLSGNDALFVKNVMTELRAEGYQAGKVVLPTAARELDVYVAGKAYFIKFNMESGDARQQAGTFLAVIGQLRSQDKTPHEYVDVRIDGRAYYK